MGKNIKLGSSASPELLAQVTGRPTVKATTPPPPPAKPLPPGVTGTPPLPTNKAVGGRAPSSLTSEERKALEAMGWSEDIPIPRNMSKLVEEIQQNYQKEVIVPPIDPRTPKLNVPIVDLATANAEEKAQARKAMQELYEFEEQQKRDAVERARQEAMVASGQAAKGIDAAKAVAEKIVAAAPPSAGLVIENDLKPPPPAPSVSQATETGGNPQLAVCPHCYWDLAITDIPEPSYEDKIKFYHGWISGKPFKKEMSLMSGMLIVTLRELTIQEIDKCYQQVNYARDKKEISENQDFYELVNRYRLFLQLSAVRSTGPDGYLIELPDGLSPETNPMAESYWESTARLDVGATHLPEIGKHILEHVLRHESMFRAVQMELHKFNRLVSKLEAMTSHPDFLKRTETPS
jgi:hypothetical protein